MQQRQAQAGKVRAGVGSHRALQGKVPDKTEQSVFEITTLIVSTPIARHPKFHSQDHPWPAIAINTSNTDSNRPKLGSWLSVCCVWPWLILFLSTSQHHYQQTGQEGESIYSAASNPMPVCNVVMQQSNLINIFVMFS